MNIRKGDNVQVISGASRGKRGKILAIYTEKGRVVIDGVNLVKKHQRPKRQGEKGEIVSLPRSINASNVLNICPSCNKGVRVGFRFDGKTKVRFCKKCQSPIEK